MWVMVEQVKLGNGNSSTVEMDTVLDFIEKNSAIDWAMQ